MENHDSVNHPKHYTSHPSGVECIEIARHYCFAIGSAIKYLWRAGLKTEEGMTDTQKEIEDLKKARWFITDRISQLEGTNRAARNEKRTSNNNPPRDAYDCDDEENSISEEVQRAADAVSHMFNAYGMLETFLAEAEGREVNYRKLEKMARRLVRANFKKLYGVNVNKITSELVMDEDSVSVQVLIPKNDEDK